MARIRSIHPDTCKSETLARISPNAERTFWRLLTECDDEGRVRDHPKLLKAALFPLHDTVTADDVDNDLSELAQHGLIVRYEKDDKPCIAVISWDEYQHPKHPTPSKLPPHGDCPTPVLPQDAPRSGPRSGVEIGEGEGHRSGHCTFGAEFEKFWNCYPRLVGKATAQSAFATAARKFGPDVIIAGAERLRDDPNLPEKQFIPHPTTWIHRQGWDDEPLPSRNGEEEWV